jgi:hypothetical protein
LPHLNGASDRGATLFSIQAQYDRAATIACLTLNMCTAQQMSTLFLHCTIFHSVSNLGGDHRENRLIKLSIFQRLNILRLMCLAKRRPLIMLRFVSSVHGLERTFGALREAR